MQKPKISCVYLDMDGVIADFRKKYKELYSLEPEVAERQKKFRSLFDQFIKANGFANLDKMPDADLGLQFLRKASVPTQILSSTGDQQKYDAVSKQKMIWLQKNAITFNPIFVPDSRLKKAYAKPDTIIIDDTESVIDDWREAGGIGIWHKNWPDTLVQLRQYI